MSFQLDRWPVVAYLFAALTAAAAAAAQTPTPQDVATFIERAEARLAEAREASSRAGWVQSTFITHDTELLAAAADQKLIELGVELANEARQFDDVVGLSEDLKRKVALLKLALRLPAPADNEKTAGLSRVTAQLQSMYGRGQYCATEDDCRDVGTLSRTLASSRDPAELLEAWTGWRTIAPPMQPLYERYVELGNEGARELGFPDLGAMWRSKYDMEPDAFAAELDRLWGQVKPLYDALHCHVRARLAEQYGPEVVDPDGPLPAHVLGNMWAQDWRNIYPLVAPTESDPGFDLTALLQARGVDAVEMVEMGQRFFTSLGFAPLPETFWERSLFTKPRDRDVVCHASAWDIDDRDDLRIKMCIEINDEDFQTIHHELGHNFYQRAYNHLSTLYLGSANDGFHEAVGDTVALSVTPSYLVQIGLLDKEPPADADIGLLLRMALDKVAFLPFGLIIDQWRWKVFSGEIPPEKYNTAWWDLRRRYQGIDAPVARRAADFDPGAKYHVPQGTPYSRYFLAAILQFQFHRALCDAAGQDGPLHRCSIYASAEAGTRLRDMLAMGKSKPWPDALEALSGQREMDATAILDYFAPLASWLEAQNAGRRCGW